MNTGVQSPDTELTWPKVMNSGQEEGGWIYRKLKSKDFLLVAVPTCWVKVFQLELRGLSITLCLWLIEAPDSLRINSRLLGAELLYDHAKKLLQVSSTLYHALRLSNFPQSTWKHFSSWQLERRTYCFLSLAWYKTNTANFSFPGAFADFIHKFVN